VPVDGAAGDDQTTVATVPQLPGGRRPLDDVGARGERVLRPAGVGLGHGELEGGRELGSPEVHAAVERDRSPVARDRVVEVALEEVRQCRPVRGVSLHPRVAACAGDPAALVEPDPCPDVLDDVKAFLDAGGVDEVVLAGAVDPGAARTIANVCRFHRTMAHGPGLAQPVVVGLDAPARSTGLVLTDGECPPDTDVTTLTDWVAAVRE
jgi:hypothetical protein